MSASAMVWAVLRFAAWEAALFGAAIGLARLVGWRDQRAGEFWLAVFAIEVTLESSIAAAFSFAGLNSQLGYWIAGAVCLLGAFLVGQPERRAAGVPELLTAQWFRKPPETEGASPVPSELVDFWPLGVIGALVVPRLMALSFKPVEEIDSINYLHYLIEWLANRATPYTFATNYVAFWELSFAPVWMVTRVDLFFPFLALKAVVLMVLGLCLVGKQLGLPAKLLGLTIFGSVLMQHYWYGPSGVPTLKNDVVHGVGFVLMMLVILRARERRLTRTDVALMAFGVAFGAVKYTGIFVAVIASGVVWWLSRSAGDPAAGVVGADGKTAGATRPYRLLAASAVALFFLLTSGHYYLHNLLRYGSPFYPFQINFAFLHLPGTADLSNTSILYSLHDPRLWRALFLPAGGISPAGLLFPAILAATLLVGIGRCALAAFAWVRRRARPSPLDWVAFFVLCGWFLYFRSVFSASAYSGDLAFIVNGLNSIRYVDGVLAVSELFLVVVLARRGWWAAAFVVINLASRMMFLFSRPELLGVSVVFPLASLLAILVLVALGRRAVPAVALCLAALGPFAVERNRARWTTEWNDLKPAIRNVAGPDLAELALPDGGYFAGHMVAVGSPMDPSVRSLLPEEIDALPAAARPRYLVVLVTPGSVVTFSWEARYGRQIGSWGYRKVVPGKMGALFERDR